MLLLVTQNKLVHASKNQWKVFTVYRSIGRCRGSCKQFEHKGAEKLIDGRNLQPSPNNIISDVPGRIGDVMEGAELERFQVRSDVGKKQGPKCGRCDVRAALRKNM